MTASAPPLTPLDFVGAIGLGLSVISLTWQGVNQFRRRRRVSVELSNATHATPVGPDIVNKILLVVTIRNTGAATGIDNVLFEFEDLPKNGYEVTPASATGAPPSMEGPLDISYLLTMNGARRILQDGEVAASGYRLSVTGYEGMDRVRNVRAVVVPARGKKIRSRYFELHPDLTVPNRAL